MYNEHFLWIMGPRDSHFLKVFETKGILTQLESYYFCINERWIDSIDIA